MVSRFVLVASFANKDGIVSEVGRCGYLKLLKKIGKEW